MTKSAAPWDLPAYPIRRKVLKLFGGSFHVYDGDRVVAFCSQAAFRLREDIRLYADETKTQELLWIQAREVIDFAASYGVVDSATGTAGGVLRRRGLIGLIGMTRPGLSGRAARGSAYCTRRRARARSETRRSS